MKITFTWDDGALEDQKLFELHEKHGIPGTFFVPTRNNEGRAVLAAPTIKAARSELVSFGAHTESHRFLTTVPQDQLEVELVQNKQYLEDILGEPIDHFCLPGGKYTNPILKKAFTHFKTVRTADTMNFECARALCKPTFHFYPRGWKSLVGNACRNYELHTALDVCINSKISYFQLIRFLTERAMEREIEGKILFWGHSWEVEELDLWDDLDALFDWVSKNYSDDCVPYNDLFEAL